MWELDYKETWVPKNWCFWTVVSEKTHETSLDCKEIKPVNSKGNQFWIFIRRTDAEDETPILWPPDVNNWLIWKDLDAGKDWRQEEKGTTEDEMVGWHHWLDGHEFEQALGVGDGQGGLVCYSPRGLKQLDTTEWLNWTVTLLSGQFHILKAQRAHTHTHTHTQTWKSESSLRITSLSLAYPPCSSTSTPSLVLSHHEYWFLPSLSAGVW